MTRILVFLLATLLFTSSCNTDHFLTDKAYRENVEIQFKKQKELAQHRSKQLFDVFEQDITQPEEEALKFIYAYSSLNDLADYNGEFFLANVRSSFAARDTFSWGKKVPEDLFRHFVLPVRVNNENLDSSRWVFFRELKDRVRNLSMREAVLEVNHWCHEKVTYRGTDIRTSSPLATVRTAFGRCGEESTLAVAALRSVGIPARQCYTPRWAHCDDNHAWVEVWVDGQWHFIGACEPEADLDLAWFTKPAKRAMLVNTTVFGDYSGPEDVLVRDRLFTRINTLQNYTSVKRIFARVTYPDGKPADSARVEFQLYNYAEFYPLLKTLTEKDGLCSFTTGFGDLLVWAAKDGRYGFRKADVRKDDTVLVVLERDSRSAGVTDLDLVPPAEVDVAVTVSDSAKEKNSQRLAFEDKLRAAYESTFIDSAKSVRFATLVGLNADTLRDLLRRSRGNWRTLTNFITGVPETSKGLIFPLLRNISEKDLRDIDSAVLYDQINFSQTFAPTGDPGQFAPYILSPRVDNEYLKPFRRYFQQSFDRDFIMKARLDPVKVAAWMRSEITLDDTSNYSRAPITPAGVYELRRADRHSAAICFVAICRSFGIPARLDPATKTPQYFSNNRWSDVIMAEITGQTDGKASLLLDTEPGLAKKPEYSIHYTLESFRDGFFSTLDYEGSPLVQDFPCTLEVPARPMLMVTGNRLADGTVLARLKFFDLPEGGSVRETIGLRKDPLPARNYGRINPSLFSDDITNGLILAWIDPGREPTRHLLADLKAKRSELERWKGRIILILPSEEVMQEAAGKERTQLPANISWSFQQTFPVRLRDLPQGGSLKNLPVVLLVRKDGTISYLSEGYRIGTVDDLLTLIQ